MSGSIVSDRSNRGLASTVNEWELFHSNAANWSAAFDLCDGARQSLCVEQYIFSQAGVGAKLLRLLALKARQGVRVRILADGFGSSGLGDSADGMALRQAGGEIVLYNSLGAFLRRPVAGAHRLHRKTILCDGARLMVGGTCFDDRMADWRDTMVRLEGALACSAALAFESTWAFACERGARPRASSPAADSFLEDGWRYVVSEPVRPSRQDIYRELLMRLDGARHSVFLATPYFFPGRRFWRALCRLPREGIRLRLLLPARSDYPSVDLVSHSFGRALARRGAEVNLYEPSMMHAKLGVVDGTWAMVSSFNLDILSFGLNVENGIASADPSFIGEMEEQLDRDVLESQRF